MTIQNTDIGTFQTSTKNRNTLGSVVTTDATQTTILSIPVAALQSCFVNITYWCENAAFTSGISATQVSSLFMRAATGNIIAASTPLTVTVSINLSLNPPSLVLVANTSTNSVDVKITGQASTTYNWHIEGSYSLSK